MFSLTAFFIEFEKIRNRIKNVAFGERCGDTRPEYFMTKKKRSNRFGLMSK
jgi:hypothetical protein